MAYATVQDVQDRMTRVLTAEEQTVCENLLKDAADIIDAFALEAYAGKKRIVSCRMVMRALGDGADVGIPMGATQGSQSALGYSQSWTLSNGASGEVYLSKLEKQILGLGNRIGSRSPLERMAQDNSCEAIL